MRSERYEQSSGNRNYNIKNVADVHNYRSEAVCKCVRFVAVVKELAVDFIEFLLRFALVIEDLYDLLTVHSLLNVAFKICNGALLADEVFCAPAADLF